MKGYLLYDSPKLRLWQQVKDDVDFQVPLTDKALLLLS